MQTFFQRLVEWLAICSLCAIPSFFFALHAYSPSGMITGVILFSIAYASITGTSWFQRIQHWPGVRKTLFIGYGTRIAISLLSLPFFLHQTDVAFLVGLPASIDLVLGILGVRIMRPFAIFFAHSDPTQFTGTLITTLIQGILINIVLLIFMAIVYLIVRYTIYRKQKQSSTTLQSSNLDS